MKRLFTRGKKLEIIVFQAYIDQSPLRSLGLQARSTAIAVRKTRLSQSVIAHSSEARASVQALTTLVCFVQAEGPFLALIDKHRFVENIRFLCRARA